MTIVLRKCARCSREFDAIVEDGNPIYCESCRLEEEFEDDRAEDYEIPNEVWSSYSSHWESQSKPAYNFAHKDRLEDSIAFKIAKNLKRNIKDNEIDEIRSFGMKNGGANRLPKSKVKSVPDWEEKTDAKNPNFIVTQGSKIDFSKYFESQFAPKNICSEEESEGTNKKGKKKKKNPNPQNNGQKDNFGF